MSLKTLIKTPEQTIEDYLDSIYIQSHSKADQIEKMLRDIHEVPTDNKKDNIKLLIKEWPLRGKSNYR